MENQRVSVMRKAGSRCWEATPVWLRRECNIPPYDPAEDEPTSPQYPRQTLNWPRKWQCPEPRQPIFLPLSRLVFCIGRSLTNRRDTCRSATFDRHMAPCQMIPYQNNVPITGGGQALAGRD
ncbi:uncharacterized protein BDW47DRAFT_114489 [Aspergillus candidus]|uniref:Uncharacterized protein n=1 Tax=Aspergillus candidus TaxID=41067 RepID=A0A2I2EXR6_ASPCN|nr:hypothetical protein BDW47DRAFT_114489 [Aspergillus candidus]PLB33175.1 hypothetical protein BDW47DRAFT_114489 [Aspergillus candidus]